MSSTDDANGPRTPAVQTYVVGSLPRPRWLFDVLEQERSGILSATKAASYMDEAIISAIRLQERAGLDVVSDGEWRRRYFSTVVADRVDGCAYRPIPGRPEFLPVVVGRIAGREPIVTAEAAYLQRHATVRTLVALPAPATLARHLWHPEYSKVAYPEPADLAWAFVPVIGEELRRLAASGIDVIQLDDPWQGFLKKASEGLGEQHVAQEIDLSVQTINAAVAAVAGPEISLHLCASHAFYAPSAPGHKSFLRALNTLRVHRITLEFASAGADHLDVLAEFPADKKLGYGAISRANDDTETVTVVVERIERALGFLPPERLTVNPDCGLAPTAKRTSGSTLDDAYDRLSILCAAARAVRETKSWR